MDDTGSSAEDGAPLTGDLAGSPLIAEAGRARRLPHPAVAIVLAVVFDVAPLALFVAVVAADVLPEDLVWAALAQTVLLGAVYGLYVLQVWVWVTRWEQRPLTSLGLHRSGAVRKLARGAAIGLGVYLGLLGVLAASGMIEGRPNPSAEANWAVVAAAVIALGGWAVQGPAEELLYRGWLLPVVAARTRLRWGIAASTIVFALSHLLGSAFDPMLMISLVLFGVFFALWALREGGLWGVFGWHAVVNWVSENLVVVGEGFGVGVLADGLVYGFEATGPDVLTGGTIGLEASLLTSAVLAVGIAVLAHRPDRQIHAGQPPRRSR